MMLIRKTSQVYTINVPEDENRRSGFEPGDRDRCGGCQFYTFGIVFTVCVSLVFVFAVTCMMRLRIDRSGKCDQGISITIRTDVSEPRPTDRSVNCDINLLQPSTSETPTAAPKRPNQTKENMGERLNSVDIDKPTHDDKQEKRP
ncbi:uncharacterized protein LOC111249731 [Varroa destructor]|uniref:Uncharacterized protein n=1 Tax=Varroa destructor TaxID=109461 RepID=A0A7M7K0V2_VARDE|nr:uncharacterized protein LOC111249731 [Varroa destructor]